MKDPIRDDLLELKTDRKKEFRKCLAEFRPHISGVLLDGFGCEINMLQFEGRNGAITSTCQKSEGNQGPVP